jgi:hypothetical protein
MISSTLNHIVDVNLCALFGKLQNHLLKSRRTLLSKVILRKIIYTALEGVSKLVIYIPDITSLVEARSSGGSICIVPLLFPEVIGGYMDIAVRATFQF